MTTDRDATLRALDYPGMADTLRRLASKRLLQKTEAQQLLDAANMLINLGHATDALLTPPADSGCVMVQWQDYVREPVARMAEAFKLPGSTVTITKADASAIGRAIEYTILAATPKEQP